MEIQTKEKCAVTNKLGILIGTTMILSTLLIADFIFKGAVFKRLPQSCQNKISEWTSR
ncbi:hypothetical protein [Virgibacillus alimentarius]|uniref:Uncharacterized protein n=1 Tax=Virgibacillus alimentarius TaxID=698769 RepID=A0ABS4SC97_9BACI|nr:MULTISPECIES: hypothetical protein [Virgibacillus]MBP2259133.1 hypothetical protein [Virgibacillus alimentarius]HLR67710.1 hypothetical protein [Virgibacillus sp.]